MCKRIDIHTHILPDEIPNWFDKYGYGDFIRMEKVNPSCSNMIKGNEFFRKIDSNCWSGEVRIKEMNQTKVDVQVLSTIPVLFNYWAKPEHGLDTSKFYNNHIAEVCAYNPDRFLGLGTLPMQDAYLAIKEMERCKHELNIQGIEIGTNINNINLDDPRFYPIWEAAEALNMAIFVHPWDMMGEEHIKKYWLPWLVGMPAETTRAICSLIFGGVLEKFPKLRFAFAHGGGSFAYTLGRIKHGFDVRPDLVAIDNTVSPEKYLNKIWVDSLMHEATSLNFLVNTMGEDKVCLGSDYPFPLGEHNPGELILSMDWSEEKKHKILWQNGWNWLKGEI